jgi:hypothetical protein
MGLVRGGSNFGFYRFCRFYGFYGFCRFHGSSVAAGGAAAFRPSLAKCLGAAPGFGGLQIGEELADARS